MSIIKVENLCKAYNEKKVLENLNLTIEKGEFIVIAGPSGCGKSTLLNILGLMDTFNKGKVTLFESTNIKPFSKEARFLLKYKIGYLFQNFALIADKTVKENIKLVLKHHAIENKDYLISSALEEVGLRGYEEKLVYKCSGGEQQRIAIAKLLIKPCELVLADEPTGSLDENNKIGIFNLLKKLHARGKTIIIATHDKELMELADRVILLGE